jgi:hypothetical protein
MGLGGGIVSEVCSVVRKGRHFHVHVAHTLLLAQVRGWPEAFCEIFVRATAKSLEMARRQRVWELVHQLAATPVVHDGRCSAIITCSSTLSHALRLPVCW